MRKFIPSFWALTGAFFGFFLFHPLVMISAHAMLPSFHGWAVSLRMAFVPAMLPWGLGYAFLGGLSAWLLARDISARKKVELRGDDVDLRHHAPLKAFILRAVQELLFNVVKHAGVSKATIDLSRSESHLYVCVGDQGKGFDPAVLNRWTTSAGLGLLSLRERTSFMGGDFLIKRALGKGSRFTLKLPCERVPEKYKAENADEPPGEKIRFECRQNTVS